MINLSGVLCYCEANLWEKIFSKMDLWQNKWKKVRNNETKDTPET